MKKLFKTLAVTLSLIAAFALTAMASDKVTFSDVPASHWAHDVIIGMAESGLLKGTTAAVNGVAEFSPDKTMTRAEVIVLVARIVNPDGIRERYGTEAWWEPYYSACGINVDSVLDWGDVDEWDTITVTREEIASLMNVAAIIMGEKKENLVALTQIPDLVEASPLHHKGILGAVSLGLVCGVDDFGTFDPHKEVSRAEVAAIAYRLINKDARCEVEFEWVNTAGYNIGTNSSAIPGTIRDCDEHPHPVFTGEEDLYSATSELRGYLDNHYHIALWEHGMAYNRDETGTVAKLVVHEDGRFGINIFQWRKDYDSGIGTNSRSDAVLEMLYYLTADREVAYALWSVVDYAAIHGYADDEYYGFTVISQTENGYIMTMNDTVIEADESGKGFTFYFN